MQQSRPETFRTSRGREIPIDADHHRFFQRTMERFKSPESLLGYIKGASTEIHGGFDKVSSEENKAQTDDIRSMSLRAYASRYVSVLALMHSLEQAGIRPQFRSMLDIGTGFAVQPRILKGIGAVTERAVGLDIVERGRNLPDAPLIRNHRLFRLYRFLDRYIERLKRRPYESLSDLDRAILLKVSSPRHRLHAMRGLLLPADIYTRYPMVARPRLDEYLVKDVFDVADQFDLVTVFSSLAWFNGRKLIEKVASLLKPGGVFYMYCPSWWAGNNCCRIGGYFPYLRQSLEPDDYRRYVEAHFPHAAEAHIAAYDYIDHTHPTLADYAEYGYQAGLVPVHVDYGISPDKYSQKYGIQPLGYALDDFPGFRRSVETVREHRPDIRVQDMLAPIISITYVKANDAPRDRAAQLDLEENRLNRRYEPSGRLMKVLKSFGARL
jgi:SAM-dependent methyltransferase